MSRFVNEEDKNMIRGYSTNLSHFTGKKKCCKGLKRKKKVKVKKSSSE